jgi:hypothetical protein
MLKQMLSMTGEEISYRMASFSHWISREKLSPDLRVLVNGSPKTGTTWMLRLVASMPGLRIAQGYNFQGEIHRYYELSPGEVVHGHDKFTNELWEILQTKNIKVIHMMRDPRDQTVSRMFHIRRDTEHILEWHHRLREMGDDRALMACIEGRAGGLPGTVDMINLTKSWLDEGDKSLCVRFESMKSSPVEELIRVLGYLDFRVDDALVRAIVERNRFERLSVGRKFWKTARKPGQEDASSHVRKGIIGDWRNYFNESHIQRYKELAGQALIEFGYEKDLDW